MPGEVAVKPGVGPSTERRARGPVAVIECYQRIPCNPCYDSCKVGAVRVFDNLNDVPEVDYEKCTGCGRCITVCPGLAIFILDETYSETEALIKIPYELLPLPAKGHSVITLDQEGRPVGEGQVVNVSKAKDFTRIVTLAIPKEDVGRVRNFTLEEQHDR